MASEYLPCHLFRVTISSSCFHCWVFGRHKVLGCASGGVRSRACSRWLNFSFLEGWSFSWWFLFLTEFPWKQKAFLVFACEWKRQLHAGVPLPCQFPRWGTCWHPSSPGCWSRVPSCERALPVPGGVSARPERGQRQLCTVLTTSPALSPYQYKWHHLELAQFSESNLCFFKPKLSSKWSSFVKYVIKMWDGRVLALRHVANV